MISRRLFSLTTESLQVPEPLRGSPCAFSSGRIQQYARLLAVLGLAISPQI
jgi:hypothetical protein